MDFPINDLMSEKASTEWLLEHFHPNGLRCPHCDAAWAEASEFRRTKKILLVRGVLKGETAETLARELGHRPVTITRLRRLILHNATHIQPETPLADNVVEADELFQNAGEKRRRTLRPARPTAPPRQPASGTRDLRQ